VAGKASGLYETEWWDAGVVICLGQGADLHMAQVNPDWFLPSWFYLSGAGSLR